jgi:hypothetical protein
MCATALDPRTRLYFRQPDGNGLNGAYRAASVVFGEVIWGAYSWFSRREGLSCASHDLATITPHVGHFIDSHNVSNWVESRGLLPY